MAGCEEGGRLRYGERGGESDDENGRFAELGWTKSFDGSGSITRTVTWELGSDLPAVVETGDVGRTSAGEDRIDGRGSSR